MQLIPSLVMNTHSVKSRKVRFGKCFAISSRDESQTLRLPLKFREVMCNRFLTTCCTLFVVTQSQQCKLSWVNLGQLFARTHKLSSPKSSHCVRSSASRSFGWLIRLLKPLCVMLSQSSSFKLLIFFKLGAQTSRTLSLTLTLLYLLPKMSVVSLMH